MNKILKSAWEGIKIAVVTFLLIGVIMMGLFSEKAESAEWFSEKPTVFLGLDYVQENSICQDKSDHITSNLGIRIPIVKHNQLNLQGGWTHHSCAFGYDAPTYDGVGLQLEWKL